MAISRVTEQTGVEHQRRAGRRLRQPRLAELIASSLRNEILSGRLTEGASLPRQEDLLDEYSVSAPAVREALRILETEGLISVRRGNVGGAVVHLPSTERSAYMLSMVLQVRHVTLEDVSASLLKLEPLCAGMCAERSDRRRAVVPKLRSVVNDQAAVLDDPVRFNRLARRFHETLVSCCGSETMKVLIGAVEMIWSAHEESIWVEAPAESPDLAGKTLRVALRDHERLLAAVEAGDANRATGLAKAHLEATRASTLSTSRSAQVQAPIVAAEYPVGSP